MKTKIQINLTILFLFMAAMSVLAEDITNIFYTEESDDDYNYQTIPQKSRAEYDKHLQDAAVKAGECRPAELDPEGHWVGVVMGFQASIRSKTNVFVMGNPILVETIFRNTTTNTLSVPLVSSGMRLGFVVKDEADHDLKYDFSKFNPAGSAFGFRPFAPMHQIKNEYDLNRQFSLKAGTYKIHTEQRVFEMSSDNKITNFTNLSSGDLLIKVVP